MRLLTCKSTKRVAVFAPGRVQNDRTCEPGGMLEAADLSLVGQGLLAFSQGPSLHEYTCFPGTHVQTDAISPTHGSAHAYSHGYVLLVYFTIVKHGVTSGISHCWTSKPVWNGKDKCFGGFGRRDCHNSLPEPVSPWLLLKPCGDRSTALALSFCHPLARWELPVVTTPGPLLVISRLGSWSWGPCGFGGHQLADEPRDESDTGLWFCVCPTAFSRSRAQLPKKLGMLHLTPGNPASHMLIFGLKNGWHPYNYRKTGPGSGEPIHWAHEETEL